ncbi:lysine--tRNA ligase [candidate division WOR-3 bacterium]|nr:lysine--tRNA ligase [candidate division WOR-3 bacterium]
MSSLGSERENRIRKLEELRGKGIEPFPYSYVRTHTVAEALEDFNKLAESHKPIRVAGRLITRRDFGKAAFFDLHDSTGRMQLYLRKDQVGEEKYALLGLVDLGDFIGAEGELFKTKTGEPSVNVKDFSVLSKSLLALPEKFHGLQDVEQRLRRRHLDLLANEETRQVFAARARLVNLVRRFFDDRGFLEVETPMLQPLYGGAAAEPFTTHYNALDRDYYLRIATELYLKRLIVGGYEKVYEIGKNFRNEGLDREHNPEFTAFECYQAYVDYHEMMQLVEELFRMLAKELCGTTKVTWMDGTYDFARAWERVEFVPTLAKKIGSDPLALSSDDLRKLCNKHGVDQTAETPYGKMLDKLFSALIQDHIGGPAFVTDHPKVISPLAKEHRTNQDLVERFEPVIGGVEFGNAFSELNDPLEQRRRFEDMAARHEEFSVLDEDFLETLEQGMPPTGGLGLGIDRMVMLFTDRASIRDVIIFPQLREDTK